MYLEASSPRRQGDRCWLVSPRFSATTNTCFQFWYSMSGQGIGSLSVIVKYPDAGTNTTVWSLSGDQGNRWIQGQVPITASRNYQAWLYILYTYCIWVFCPLFFAQLHPNKVTKIKWMRIKGAKISISIFIIIMHRKKCII